MCTGSTASPLIRTPPDVRSNREISATTTRRHANAITAPTYLTGCLDVCGVSVGSMRLVSSSVCIG